MVLVSLGSNCAVAYQLGKLNLRDGSYPFDWSKVKLDGLINVLESDFVDYSKVLIQSHSIKHFSLSQSDNSDNSGSFILSNRYGIGFAHEVVLANSINEFSKKLDRRIIRLKGLINPTFIRLETSNISKLYNVKYIKLVDILSKMFIHFKLIVISNNRIDHEKIIWIKLDNFDEDWTYSKLDWFKIFNL